MHLEVTVDVVLGSPNNSLMLTRLADGKGRAPCPPPSKRENGG